MDITTDHNEVINLGSEQQFTEDSIDTATTAVLEALADIEAHEGDAYAAAKQQVNKQRVVEAWNTFTRDRDDWSLFKAVLAFAKVKTRKLDLLGFERESYITADDVAQEVAMSVWDALERGMFEGDGNDFYHWLNRICFTESKTFYRRLDRQPDYLPLMVQKQFDDTTEVEEVDNPALWRTGGWGGSVVSMLPKDATPLERAVFGEMSESDWKGQGGVWDSDRPNYVAKGSRLLDSTRPYGKYRPRTYAEIAARLSGVYGRLRRLPEGTVTEHQVDKAVRRLKSKVKRARLESTQHRDARYAAHWKSRIDSIAAATDSTALAWSQHRSIAEDGTVIDDDVVTVKNRFETWERTEEPTTKRRRKSRAKEVRNAA